MKEQSKNIHCSTSSPVLECGQAELPAAASGFAGTTAIGNVGAGSQAFVDVHAIGTFKDGLAGAVQIVDAGEQLRALRQERDELGERVTGALADTGIEQAASHEADETACDERMPVFEDCLGGMDTANAEKSSQAPFGAIAIHENGMDMPADRGIHHCQAGLGLVDACFDWRDLPWIGLEIVCCHRNIVLWLCHEIPFCRRCLLSEPCFFAGSGVLAPGRFGFAGEGLCRGHGALPERSCRAGSAGLVGPGHARCARSAAL
ncbi:hypothetical protein [Jiella marina]|uniref:hypothetical protein n=1 Tax=Jiella sp. LLJ827 TaxID=2917712 RepID=UPI002101A361|nr:hypothetical protein [Jiella sp. LLJ827]MCQ0990549.1 hypothetical protein [Jiella sp. LLJ827]